MSGTLWSSCTTSRDAAFVCTVTPPEFEDWLLPADDELLTEISECGRLPPLRRCSNEETAIELRILGTEMSNSESVQIWCILATRGRRYCNSKWHSGQAVKANYQNRPCSSKTTKYTTNHLKKYCNYFLNYYHYCYYLNCMTCVVCLRVTRIIWITNFNLFQFLSIYSWLLI